MKEGRREEGGGRREKVGGRSEEGGARREVKGGRQEGGARRETRREEGGQRTAVQLISVAILCQVAQ